MPSYGSPPIRIYVLLIVAFGVIYYFTSTSSSLSLPHSFRTDGSSPAYSSKGQPTIYYLPPPPEMQRALAYCSSQCEGKEWNEGEYLRSRNVSEKMVEAFGQEVNMGYSEDWPYHVRKTDQFALNSIISLHMSSLAAENPIHFPSADFIYLALDTRQAARCFGGCRGQKEIPLMDRRELRREVMQWILETVDFFRFRRSYPSLIMSLALIDHDYEKNLLAERLQRVMGEMIVLGIEREPWETKNTLNYFEQMPYPSVFHLQVRESRVEELEVEKELRKWAISRERKFLLSFAGRSSPTSNNSGKGPHNGFLIREALATQVLATSSTDIALNLFSSTSNSGDNSLLAMHLSMSQSTFCLQPPGDSPTRKGFYESILLGCIPVIFRSGTYTTFGNLDLGMGNGIEELAILIDEEEIIAGKGGDVMERLRGISKEEIKRKTYEGRKWMRTVQYSLPIVRDDGEVVWDTEDAFGLLMMRLIDVRNGVKLKNVST